MKKKLPAEEYAPVIPLFLLFNAEEKDEVLSFDKPRFGFMGGHL
jgi:hypothetical protein